MLAKFNVNRMKTVWVINEKHATQKWQKESDFYFSNVSRSTPSPTGVSHVVALEEPTPNSDVTM